MPTLRSGSLSSFGLVLSCLLYTSFSLLLEHDRTTAEKDVGFDLGTLLEEGLGVLQLEVVVAVSYTHLPKTFRVWELESLNN